MTEVVDINVVQEHTKIVDALKSAQAPVTLIDVRAGLMSQTLRVLQDIGLIRAAAHGQPTFAIFHILGPTIVPLDEIAQAASYLEHTHYFIVKNFINNSQFFEWNEATHSSYFNRFREATEIKIPKLNEMAMEQVELASVPFVKFVAQASHSLVLRGYVQNWLSKVWAEYDRIGLMEIVRKDHSLRDATRGQKRVMGTRNGPDAIGRAIGGRAELRRTVNRASLYDAVYEKCDLSRQQSAMLVELVLKEITDCLERGETVKLASFGSFIVRKKGQRTGRNPKTGEKAVVSPRRVIVFKPSEIVKQHIKSGLQGGTAEPVSHKMNGRTAIANPNE